MEEYKELFHLEIEHDYFPQGVCPAIDIRIKTDPERLLKNRQLMFRSLGLNSWSLMGDVNNGGVYEGQDRIDFDFVLSDPVLEYCTEWEDFEKMKGFYICLSHYAGKVEVVEEWKGLPEEPHILVKLKVFIDKAQTLAELKAMVAAAKMGEEVEVLVDEAETLEELKVFINKGKQPGVLFNGSLTLSDEMYKRAVSENPWQVKLHFKARAVFWEYFFIQRNTDRKIKKLLLKEQEGRLDFTAPTSEVIPFLETEGWACTSKQPLRLNKTYAYQLGLFEIQSTDPLIMQRIVRNAGWPEPGDFYDKEKNCIRKVVYF